MRPGDRLGFQAGVGGEGEQKRLVGDEIVEHRVQERRVPAAVRRLWGPRPVRLRNRLSRSESAAMKARPLTASDRPASRLADCFIFRESRIVRFAFRKCLAASLAGAPAEFTFHGTPDAQNRAHC